MTPEELSAKQRKEYGFTVVGYEREKLIAALHTIDDSYNGVFELNFIDVPPELKELADKIVSDFEKDILPLSANLFNATNEAEATFLESFKPKAFHHSR